MICSSKICKINCISLKRCSMHLSNATACVATYPMADPMRHKFVKCESTLVATVGDLGELAVHRYF